ncbi:hypothetical protein JEQ17_49090 (plasmid) [Streptomyces liliifuscus]|uniref:Uncharacterized protein n=1 Tax=Streptomyces liliifuscus TaxID=2797636 RepID=A0A7T7RI61_9ACTN|nr:hypothetical protein [Streptomyces liliifuscus]QQM47521.1 hypothetical protein JEQ17_49090 [Streptomyces liliifuscus]
MPLTQTAGLFGVRRQARVGPAGVELGGIGDRVRFEEPVGAVPMLGSVQLRLPAVDEHPIPHVGPLGRRRLALLRRFVQGGEEPALKLAVLIGVNSNGHCGLASVLTDLGPPWPAVPDHDLP